MKQKKHDSGQTAQGQPQAEQTVGQETDAQSPEGQDAAQEPDPQAELARQKDAYLRLYAEFDNYKKRSARERVEWIKMASSEVLESLLTISMWICTTP